MIDDQEKPPPPAREDKLPPTEDTPAAIELPGTPQLPIIPDEDAPSEGEDQ